MSEFRKDEKQKKEEKQSVFTKETLGVILILFSALSLVCIISRDKVFGTPGTWINWFFFGTFGYLSYLVAICFATLGVCLVVGKKIPLDFKYKLYIVLSVVFLGILLQVASVNPNNYSSYGEYLSAVYGMGEEGVASSISGLLFGLVAYWLNALLSDIGTYVVMGILSALFIYLTVRGLIQDNSKVKGTKDFNSSCVKKADEKLGVNGEGDYPIEGVFAEKDSGKPSQKLFVDKNDNFNFKTKKEMNKSGDVYKLNFEKNGLGVIEYETSYTNGYTKDLDKKIEYVKTPTAIDDDTINKIREESTDTTVSNPIQNDKVDEGNGLFIKKKEEDIPFIEHEDEQKTDETEINDEADKFNGYANIDEVEGEGYTPSFNEIKEEDEAEKEEFVAESHDEIEERKIDDISDEEIKEALKHDDDEELPSSNVTQFTPKRIILGGVNKKEPILPQEEVLSEECVDSVSEEKHRAELPSDFVYKTPPIDLLETYPVPTGNERENHSERIQIIEKTLSDFNINAKVTNYIEGPTITRYEVMMPAGISVKSVLKYDDDLKMWLESNHGIRIEAPIPGKSLVGIEVANKHSVKFGLKDVLTGLSQYQSKPDSLLFAIGKDIVGKPIFDYLEKGPHFLVAGATGSGKSVCLNLMIVSLIMRYSPAELRLILVDPKGNEFKPYEHLPHLLVDEIITDSKKAMASLAWVQQEMERRYNVLAEEGGVRDIVAYNESRSSNDQKMPRIVVIVDELSNLMEENKKDLEARILSLVQKSRAVGIHLVLATQRPSVDVITGTIKANLPSRMALKVTNFADSNTILGEGGAEKLLGYGDMLYRSMSMEKPIRYQGAFISDNEIYNIVEYIKENNACYFDDYLKDYLEESVKPKEEVAPIGGGLEGESASGDDLFIKALWFAVSNGNIAISQIQRRFSVGYPRAGGIVDKMDRLGYLAPTEGSKPRRVLLSKEAFINKYGEMPNDGDITW